MKLTKIQKKMLKTLMFLVKLIILSIPMYVVMVFHGLLTPLQIVVTRNVHEILTFLGINSKIYSTTIAIKTAKPFLFVISEDCTGWKSMLFFIALVLAVDGVDMKKRIYGLLAGLPIIYAGNLIRILAVVYIQQSFGTSTAMVFHDYLWQVGLISLVIVVWISWLILTGRFLFKNPFHKIKKW